MATQHLITLENILINTEYENSINIYLSPIFTLDNKLEGIKIFRGFIRSKFNKLFLENGITPDIVAGVIIIKKELLYFTYKPSKKEVEFSSVFDGADPFIYIPTEIFKNTNRTIGLLGIFAPKISFLKEKLTGVLRSFSEEVSRIVIYTTGNISNKQICEIVKSKLPYIEFVYISRKDSIEVFAIRKKEYVNF